MSWVVVAGIGLSVKGAAGEASEMGVGGVLATKSLVAVEGAAVGGASVLFLLLVQALTIVSASVVSTTNWYCVCSALWEENHEVQVIQEA